MVETRSGKMQDPAQERIKAEEFAKPQPEVTYEVEPVDPSPRSRKAKDIVHVIRMKPYLDPEEQNSILLGNTSRDRFPSRTRAETS
ncbi:hypothetical protein LAZ67_8001557 [Cordylochernes scorpioides]|uniref:Uncharacterized protein n=1 Tax=Cordylochernes scorpioides TaxID=51811 RepID=A0ABY6KQA5_9ARAC|nr:hypothetical protein LAZ67_8001557 [Cordylochernes scorpioides]